MFIQLKKKNKQRQKESKPTLCNLNIHYTTYHTKLLILSLCIHTVLILLAIYSVGKAKG